MKKPAYYADILGFFGDVAPPAFDETTLRHVAGSGIRLIHLTSAWPFHDWDTTLRMHKETVSNIEKHAPLLQIIRKGADLEALEEGNRIGVILGLQDPGSVSGDLGRIHTLFEAGVRVLQIGYQARNRFGCGYMAEDEDAGLTGEGRRFVAALNRAGMILDLSHLSPRTALDCIDMSTGSIMISHTTARSVYDHPRGCPDEVLRAIARLDQAIVGILGMTFFLHDQDNGLEPLIRHFTHMAGIIGTEKLAVGSDGPVGGFTDPDRAERLFFEKTQRWMDPCGELRSRWPTHIPELFNTPSGFECLQKALSEHFDTRQLEGILGLNAWSFFRRSLPSD